ncbi:MAG: nickel pincer cofactor biosynthesis protein LarC [Bacillota bacterium]|jgi:uncharacterized protein (TIGR00299 family) protein
MMKVAYFDCFSGISGDMTLGALLDAGLPLEVLEDGLNQLHLPEFSLSVSKVQKCGLAATSVQVNAEEGHVHRGLPEISQIIEQSGLPAAVKERSLQVFTVLAQAEARIHGSTPEEVHFHEVGAVDAIVDIVGACIGLHALEIEQVFCSALPTGGGQVRSAHGIIPVPAPATLALLALRNVPLYDNGQRAELVTPTGAALMVALAEDFGVFPQLKPQMVGYGAGQKDLPVANVLRVVIGESSVGVAASPQHSHGGVHAHVHDHAHPHSDHHHDHAHPHSDHHDHTHPHSCHGPEQAESGHTQSCPCGNGEHQAEPETRPESNY